MAGCTQQQNLSSSDAAQQSEPPPASESYSEPDLSGDNSESSVEDDLGNPSNEISEDEFFDVANKIITAYENGTIETNEQFPSLPQDFLFPKNRSKEDITISYSEGMGDYRITLTSADGKWDMVLVANNFVYVDAETVTGGDLHVTDVVFVER
jgi:uncharacterized protein YozE (UPF0346 family)